jgi:hypothetical protein
MTVLNISFSPFQRSLLHCSCPSVLVIGDAIESSNSPDLAVGATVGDGLRDPEGVALWDGVGLRLMDEDMDGVPEADAGGVADALGLPE